MNSGRLSLANLRRKNLNELCDFSNKLSSSLNVIALRASRSRVVDLDGDGRGIPSTVPQEIADLEEILGMGHALEVGVGELADAGDVLPRQPVVVDALLLQGLLNLLHPAVHRAARRLDLDQLGLVRVAGLPRRVPRGQALLDAIDIGVRHPVALGLLLSAAVHQPSNCSMRSTPVKGAEFPTRL